MSMNSNKLTVSAISVLHSKHRPILVIIYGFSISQAFKEGSPLHPSYGAGHAVVAGACVTILKAWFKDVKPIPGTIWEANHDGSKLKEYEGNDKNDISVHSELNKLAANISNWSKWSRSTLQK